jgi:hypothetical protein
MLIERSLNRLHTGSRRWLKTKGSAALLPLGLVLAACGNTTGDRYQSNHSISHALLKGMSELSPIVGDGLIGQAAAAG